MTQLQKALFTAESAESAENLREKLSAPCVLCGEITFFYQPHP
jgi:hypothetical protein